MCWSSIEALRFPEQTTVLWIRPKLWHGIGNFQSRRSIQFVVHEIYSNTVLVIDGVPQGFVLSSILFLPHINDLLSSSFIPICSYVDDSILISLSSAHFSSVQKPNSTTTIYNTCSHNRGFVSKYSLQLLNWK